MLCTDAKKNTDLKNCDKWFLIRKKSRSLSKLKLGASHLANHHYNLNDLQPHAFKDSCLQNKLIRHLSSVVIYMQDSSASLSLTPFGWFVSFYSCDKQALFKICFPLPCLHTYAHTHTPLLLNVSPPVWVRQRGTQEAAGDAANRVPAAAPDRGDVSPRALGCDVLHLETSD